MLVLESDNSASSKVIVVVPVAIALNVNSYILVSLFIAFSKVKSKPANLFDLGLNQKSYGVLTVLA